jgi:polyhydroxyalkanoate synthesis repressor PhaR
MTIIIKRYQNRKLYNTHSKRYITLNEIEDLIKNQAEIKIIDNTSGRDITAATLSQIIFELEKNYSSFLPIKLLVSLVQTSGSRMEEIRRRVFDSLNLSHHYDVEIERRVNLLTERGYFSQDEGNRILGKLLEVGFKQDELIAGFENRIIDYFEQRQLPSKNDFESLTKRVENLSKRVDTLSVDSIADKTN